jgi:hypothetical protein
MATIPVEPACPICLISFRLAVKGSTKARHLFLDGEGQIRSDPNWLPREQALLLARNQQLIWGSAASGLGLLPEPRFAAGPSALQRLQPRKQKAVLVHALDGSGRNGLHMSVRVLGQDDIHGMGLIKGLHHLDAIAQ